MKRVKQFLLVITGVSLFFITGCTTAQNIPYDDVYYSTAKGSPQYLVAQNSNTSATEPSHYKVEKVEAVNTSGQNTKSTVNQNQQSYQFDSLRVDTIKTNNFDSLTYSKINTGLGFDNPNFGTGIYSWSLGGGGIYGFNNFWYDPYWYNFYYPYSYPYYNWSWNPYYSWGYPYYYGYGGWGLYSYGNPYWGFGFNYPYYGYSGYYGYPGYYSPYHYWHRNRYYGHRGGASLSGSYIPLSGGNVPLARTKSTVAGTRSSRSSNIKSSEISRNSRNTVARPEGSVRYQKATRDTKASRLENTNRGTMFRKPPVYNPNNRTSTQRQNQERAVYRRPSNMTTPRYQKPKQYQSLDTRQVRSSNEYFRPQPQTIIHGKATRVNAKRTPQRFNIYRPNNTRSNFRRPVYRNSWIRNNRSVPVRHFNNRPPQRFNSSPQFNRSSQNNSRSFTPPARIGNGGGNSGGNNNSGGGNSRGGGGGNIRR